MGFFKPDWQSGDQEKAMKAVERETNQAKLGNIVKNARLDEVRYSALEKISEPAVLGEIIKKADREERLFRLAIRCEDLGYKDLAIEAIEKMTDQNFLERLADKTMRPEAIKKLNRERIPPYMVRLLQADPTGSLWWFTLGAEEMREFSYPEFHFEDFTDEHYIEIACGAQSRTIVAMALKKISDPDKLREIARKHPALRLSIAELLGDQAAIRTEREIEINEMISEQKALIEWRGHINFQDNEQCWNKIGEYYRAGDLPESVMNQTMYDLCFLGPHDKGTNGSNSVIAELTRMYATFIGYITDEDMLRDIIDKHDKRWHWLEHNPIAAAAQKRIEELGR
jgi:hypothetical protein